MHGKDSCSGLYSSVSTCYMRNGSDGYEDKDAATYASWGVDYVKYNTCNNKVDLPSQFQRMAAAVEMSGRPMLFSLSADPFAEWMMRPNIQLRRTAPTIGATWDKVLTNLETNAPLAAYSRPGGFNDPDMLEVGNGALNERENRAHFSVWSVMGAPLLAATISTT